MPRYPLRQPPSGWRLSFVSGEGWYVLDAHWQPIAGPYTERWYAVQAAERLAAREQTEHEDDVHA